VVSEEKIFEKVYRRTIAHTGEIKMSINALCVH
jgi:hypothetical protein